MDAALARSVAIFRELGWAKAPLSATPTLPLGTAEQRKEALAGLLRGPWGGVRQFDAFSGGWVSYIPVDDSRLGIFATRLGVDARRAVEVLPAPMLTEDLVRGILLPRGAAFATAFIRHGCVASTRPWENCTTPFGSAAVLLVHELELPVPDNVEYLKDWIVVASSSVGIPAQIDPFREPIPAALIALRCAEHLRAAAAVGVPVTGLFADLFPAALRAGWIERGAALESALQGLDTARRPGDRAVWTRLIADDLAVTDDELAALADALIPALATGSAAVVEAFAARLIARVDDDALVDVLTAALCVRTKKALRAVLVAASARPAPSAGVIADLADQLVALTADKDRAVANAARRVLDGWSVSARPATVPEAGVRGRWRPTPQLWTVPRFEPDEPGVEALARAAGVLASRPEGSGVDIETEHFLHLANALAGVDPDAVQRGLRGVASEWRVGLRPVPDWLAGTRPDYGLDGLLSRVEDALLAREFAVFQRLGQVPVLLSTPSWIDLRIDPSDLVGRLRGYAEAGVDATEADLLLALARVELDAVTPLHLRALEALRVRVVRQNGIRMRATAGPVAAAYLRDPIREPELLMPGRRWRAAEVRIPPALRKFPGRLHATGYSQLYVPLLVGRRGVRAVAVHRRPVRCDVAPGGAAGPAVRSGVRGEPAGCAARNSPQGRR